MKKPTLYLETSVPSYLLAEPSRDVIAVGRQELTRKWWLRDHGRFDIFVSEVVLEEAGEGNPKAAKKRLEFLEKFEVLKTTPEVERLAQFYVLNKVVPPKYQRDGAHLALASLFEIDFLCTWNFRHLANAFALKRFRDLNKKEGLFVPQVCTPEELFGE
ncbi:MAG: type II toxin-antitoxin system VapC family toxin [Candidatus Hydrogenedentes bacterium]|nr:type II toxin-antitoxin system VapC family toxin [Candidatus Hydrogenedentota bacterium]